jgi:hypothetical protein
MVSVSFLLVIIFSPFWPSTYFHICSIAISSHCLVHHCLLSFTAIRYCFSSLIFVTADLEPDPAFQVSPDGDPDPDPEF